MTPDETTPQTAQSIEATDNRKPKTIDTENMEYDPYDHEMLANEPNF